MERHVPRGGGNSLKPSHNQDFSLIETFNNLALWGEKKFVSELKRTYKFQRGVNNILDCHANQTRILSKEYSFVAGDYVRSTAQDDENLNRLRNKCAMTDYGHAELVSVSCGLNPSPAFQAPSPQVARGKIRSIGNMKENIFSNMVNSLFITHHSLKRPGATHVALCESVGSYFRHWCGAFTLAEVLITLGIIGVVAAMTMPSLITAKQEKATISTIKKNYSVFANALLMAQNDNGELYTWGITKDADGLNLVCSNLKPYLKIIEDCGVGEKSDCAPGDNGKFKDLTGRKRTEDFSSSDYYSFRLNDGTAVAIQLKTKAECISSESSCMNFYIDTNGKKHPNTLGKDIFYFDGYGNGKLRAAGIDHSPSETGWTAQEGWFTTAWAMYKENLDYLRCPDKLEWNGKSTCK